MRDRKMAMVAGLYANTNWDDEKNDRQKALAEIDDNFDETVKRLYIPGYAKQVEKEYEIDYNDPFWAAMKRGQDKFAKQMADLGIDAMTGKAIEGAEPAEGMAFDQGSMSTQDYTKSDDANTGIDQG